MTGKKPVLRFFLRDVRLAFPNLSTPGKFGYGCRLILSPSHTQTLNPQSRAYCEDLGIKLPADPKAAVKTVPLLKQIGLAVAKRKWAAKGDAVYKALEGQDKVFLHDGDTKADLDGFAGNLFVSCGSRGPVPMFDQQRNDATERECFSGSYVVAQIDVWAQDNSEGGKRLNASVYGIQALRKGDAFSSGGPAAEGSDFDEELSAEGTEGAEESGSGSNDVDLTA